MRRSPATTKIAVLGALLLAIVSASPPALGQGSAMPTSGAPVTGCGTSSG
ncbi:MAG: hypothetical protein ACYDDF_06165 [Thermoplasmatota archaeon]